MQNAARLGDAHGHGGVIVTGSGDVYINGISAARLGDGVVCSLPVPHASVIACGSGSVFINSLAAARLGDLAGCGAPICTGSGDVLIGG